MLYPVIELSRTIQGEGAYTGYPVTLLRLAGCHHQCSFCDTAKAWKIPPRRNWFPVSFLIKEMQDYNRNIVLITGGEPLLWNLEPLVSAIHKQGWKAHVETTGEIDTRTRFDWVSISPKGGKICLRAYNEVKWLVPNWTLKDIESLIASGSVKKNVLHYVQPLNDVKTLDTENVLKCLEMIRRAKFPLALSIQLHKVVSNLPTTKKGRRVSVP